MIKTIKHVINLIKSKTRDIGLGKRSPKWKTVEKHFKLQNPTCAICGTKNKLNVHHKQPFHLHPELELDYSNLITLCMSKMECHLLIGHGNNFRLFNSNIDEDVAVLNKDISRFEEIAAKAQINAKTNF